jgi:PhzF family phenazine biosynthesis protein
MPNKQQSSLSHQHEGVVVRPAQYRLAAFATDPERGNPAAVVPLPVFPDDAVMEDIACHNALPETAFVVRQDPGGERGDYRIRWFTPTTEVPLCGHATLAAAAVVMEHLDPGRERVVFDSRSGPLTVVRRGEAYAMDFPVRVALPVAMPTGLAQALGAAPVAVLEDAGNFTAVYTDEDVVRTLAPDLDAIARLPKGGVVVTAPARSGSGFDIVSRYFAPAKGIPEDPVTGGAHCALTPYWAARLGKTRLRAWQASSRGGELRCRLLGDRVELEGDCVFVER